MIEDRIAGVYGAPSLSGDPGPSKTSGNNELGKDAFLNLLITQLANQDPLNPLEDKDFIAQMAQFTSLEQMTNMNTTLERLSTMNRTAAIGLMGHEVIYGGSDGRLTSGKVVGVRFDAGKIFVAVGEDETLLENIVAVSS
ncbi:MAG: Basal-body rod modification protein FlgD [Synergistetes bacterium ADurb.Bin520]|nr:MAG: Basal-body rod modification protein FlgD [Synergistetes bacterium ADurb.Bin520]